jgi:hypothetical protein
MLDCIMLSRIFSDDKDNVVMTLEISGYNMRDWFFSSGSISRTRESPHVTTFIISLEDIRRKGMTQI